MVANLYLKPTNQCDLCWIILGIKDRRAGAAARVQHQVHARYHDPPTPPDCFPGSVSCRHQDRGPDTPSCLSSCLSIRSVQRNPPICSFSPTMQSLLLHFSVAAGKTPPALVHSNIQIFKYSNSKFKCKNPAARCKVTLSWYLPKNVFWSKLSRNVLFAALCAYFAIFSDPLIWWNSPSLSSQLSPICDILMT